MGQCNCAEKIFVEPHHDTLIEVVDNEASIHQLENRPPTRLADNSLYTGQWSGNVREGKGRLENTDGGVYEGEFKNNVAHGQGEYRHPSGDLYGGEWKFDKADGYGIFTHADGSRYEGYWKQNFQEGRGKEIWKDGCSFEGIYKQSQKTGLGKFQWSDGSYYSGEFKNNELDGFGTYYWAGKAEKKIHQLGQHFTIELLSMCGSPYQTVYLMPSHTLFFVHSTYHRVYIGDWVGRSTDSGEGAMRYCTRFFFSIANHIEGEGQTFWPDGRSYVGQYKKDKKHGQGVFRWADGRIYAGGWKNGKQHGHGIYTNAKGISRSGEWNEGRRLRWLPDADGVADEGVHGLTDCDGVGEQTDGEKATDLDSNNTQKQSFVEKKDHDISAMTTGETVAVSTNDGLEFEQI